MKRIVLCVLSLLAVATVEAQVNKKASLMVVPSRQWCNANGFMTEYDNMGTKVMIPDYQKAFDSSAELNLVVAKIGQLMSERGFTLRLMSAALQTVNNRAAEEMLLQSKDTGATVSESPIDKIRKVAKADVWLEVSWQLNKGIKNSLTFNLSGVDAYTDLQIANCQGTGEPSYSTELPVLLFEAVNNNLSNFVEQLEDRYNDWMANGRVISLEVKRFADCEYDFESEFAGKELGMIIEDWVSANTVQSQFSTDDATENMMIFSNVRIPMITETGVALDARRWGRNLQRMLRDNYAITAKIMTRGLGHVVIVMGGK